MIVTIYKSYGVLGHEKQPVYTWGAGASEIYDAIRVELPQVVGVNQFDEPLIEIDGLTYALSEILTNRGDKPAIILPGDGPFTHYKVLREIAEAEGDHHD